MSSPNVDGDAGQSILAGTMRQRARRGRVAACMTIRRACGTIFYYIVRSWAMHAAERSVAAVAS